MKQCKAVLYLLFATGQTKNLLFRLRYHVSRVFRAQVIRRERKLLGFVCGKFGLSSKTGGQFVKLTPRYRCHCLHFICQGRDFVPKLIH